MIRAALVLMMAGLAVTPNLAVTTALTLAVPGRSNANVSLASAGNFMAATWSASMSSGQTDIYAAVSTDGARMFSSPVRVNSTPGDARVNGEQPPRVALVPRTGGAPAIAIVWTSKNEKGSTLLTARSEDGGRTFGRTALVPGGEAAGNRGWEAITVDSSGRVSVLWLDHRRLAQQPGDMPSMHHATHATAPGAKPDGVAMAQLSQLYFARLDGSIAPRPLTGGVCYCCKTALVGGPAGAIYAAWRHVYPGNLRDVAFALSRDAGRTFAEPIRVSEDKWQIEGCPDDGPALARAGDGRLHIVWPTLVSEGGPGGQPTIGLFHATSADGKSFSPRVRVPTEGLAHHPQIAIAANGSVALTWDELVSGRRRVVLARGEASAAGRITFVRQVLSAGEPAIYPAVAASADGVVTAWTSGAPSTSVIRLESR